LISGDLLAQPMHRLRRTKNAVQQNHGPAFHRRQVFRLANLLQFFPTIIQRARCVTPVMTIEQSIMAGEHISLDAPIMKELDVSPELSSPPGLVEHHRPLIEFESGQPSEGPTRRFVGEQPLRTERGRRPNDESNRRPYWHEGNPSKDRGCSAEDWVTCC